jgi:hypothetical protein
MKDRDKELEDLQRELEGAPAGQAGGGRPFLHRPEQLDIGAGALCFLDGARLCGPDCVAFNAAEGLDENGHPIDNPNKCLVLTYMGQQGAAALGIIAMSRTAIKSTQDRRREEQMGGAPGIPDLQRKV